MYRQIESKCTPAPSLNSLVLALFLPHHPGKEANNQRNPRRMPNRSVELSKSLAWVHIHSTLFARLSEGEGKTRRPKVDFTLLSDSLQGGISLHRVNQNLDLQLVLDITTFTSLVSRGFMSYIATGIFEICADILSATHNSTPALTAVGNRSTHS